MAAFRAAALGALLILGPLPLALSLPAASALAPSDILVLPRMALGFDWTYHYAGATDVILGGFRATYMTDTYTSAITAESPTPRGDAWVVSNNHAGTLSGTVPPGLPSTGTFTSLTSYYIRKSDLAVLNSTQDITVSASVPIIGTISGSGHNDTYANPPLAQTAFGSPADGTPWRIVSNLTDVGWYKIGASPQVNTFSYLALDFNLSVTAIETAAVPAGSLPSYNITGGGTADNNGTLDTFTQGFLYAPDALNKAVDESGYLLQSFHINRAPVVSGLPPLEVNAGRSATLDLTAYLSDPDNDPFNLSCAPAPPLSCSVAPNGTLTVTALPGVNATFLLNLTADDGRPVGAITFPLTVLVTDTGNPNLPPEWMGPPLFEMVEDTDATFFLANLIFDPDDVNHTFAIVPQSPLIVLAANGSSFTLHTPPNYYGSTSFNITVFDEAGNSLTRTIAVTVYPVNDPPTLTPLSDLTLFVHTGGNVTASVVGGDIDGPSLTYAWLVDGAQSPYLLESPNFTYISPEDDRGTHTLTALATDSLGAHAQVSFTVHVFEGPTLTYNSPQVAAVRVANGTTLAFEIRASDPDTATLAYSWSSGPVAFGGGPNLTRFSLLVAQSAPFDVLAVAADNGSFVGFLWHITVEEIPPDLVSILAPSEGSAFTANAAVSVSALIDPRLSDLTVRWSLDGAFLSLAEDARTPTLPGPSNHTLMLDVSGVYNATLPYAVHLTVNFTVLAPTPPNNSNGSGNGNGNGGTLPASGGDLLLVVLAILLAATLGAAPVLRQRRRRAPPT